MKAFASIVPAVSAVILFFASSVRAGEPDKPYWINLNSRVIHNRNCTFYGASRGAFVGADADGFDCGRCGGKAVRGSGDIARYAWWIFLLGAGFACGAVYAKRGAAPHIP